MLSGFQYPDGGAAAARHRALAAGLEANGHRVTFVLVWHRVPSVPSSATTGVRWVSLCADDSSSRVSRRMRALTKLRRALASVAASDAIDGVLIFGLDPVIHHAGLRAGRSLGLPVLQELTEFPDVILSRRLYPSLARAVYLRRHLHDFSGVVVISTAIQQYVEHVSDVPTLLLGALLDLPNHPEMPPLQLTDALIIGYAGSLSEAKDGILTLLRAAAAAMTELPAGISLRIVVLGATNALDGPQAMLEADRLGIADRVVFHGQVPHGSVHGLLSRCHLLALPRPDSRQALGGFPTKLAEYMSTGRPVVVTPVGDIPRYLTDRQDCIMAVPGSVQSLARCIVEVAADYSAARTIGFRGRAVAERSFAATVQAPHLVDFTARLRATAAR